MSILPEPIILDFRSTKLLKLNQDESKIVLGNSNLWKSQENEQMRVSKNTRDPSNQKLNNEIDTDKPN